MPGPPGEWVWISIPTLRPPPHGRTRSRRVVKAVVEVTSHASAGHTFRVPLAFESVSGGRVDFAKADLTLKAGETRRVDVPMTTPAKAGEVHGCRVGEVETLTSPSPTSTSGSGSTGSVTTTGGSGGKSTSTPKPRSTKKTR